MSNPIFIQNGVIDLDNYTVESEGIIYKVSSASFELLESGIYKDKDKIKIIPCSQFYSDDRKHNNHYCVIVCPKCGHY